MSDEVTVHLPARVWAALGAVIVDDDRETRGWRLPITVRQRVRDAVERRVDRPVPTVFRVLTLSRREADALENWLTNVCLGPDAPRESVTVLELLREGIRLAS